MRLIQVIALAIAAFAASSVAHEGHSREPPRKVPDIELHRPTPMPDRIILTWSGDPATTQAVTWRTDPTIRKALAQIAVATAGPGFAKQSKQYDATTTSLATDLAPAHYHSIEFTGLSPGTKYAYRVGDGINWSEWFQFRTASSTREPFAFVYFGDAQNDIKSLWSRVIRQAYGDVPDLRFMVHAGDLINNANNDAQWGEWFAGGGWANAMVSSVPSPGNHEYFREESEFETPPRRLSGHWTPQFTLPQNGPEGLKESVYFLDYQGVRIISLNSNRLHEQQAEWLDATLTDNPCAWTVITFHHPIYSPAKRRDNPELRGKWQPMFDKHRVDLVLTGHDHSYARSGLERFIDPAGARNVATGRRHLAGGTVYVVSVSGPKMYEIDRTPRMRRAAEDTQLYQIIRIDGPTLRFEARTALGDLYDAFELRKRPGETNELVEHVPQTPERRRPSGPKVPSDPGSDGAGSNAKSAGL